MEEIACAIIGREEEELKEGATSNENLKSIPKARRGDRIGEVPTYMDYKTQTQS